jgi:ketosteroid isomerase-like protein
MSRENVERVRGILEDFRTDKWEFDADGMLTKIAGEELMDPDIEWDASEAAFDLSGVHRGVGAVRQWWGEWLAAWETLEFEYELVDAGDRVVALIDQRMRGLNTGIEVSLGKYAHVYTFRDGLVVHWKIYLRQSEALEAVGRSEQDARTGR